MVGETGKHHHMINYHNIGLLYTSSLLSGPTHTRLYANLLLTETSNYDLGKRVIQDYWYFYYKMLTPYKHVDINLRNFSFVIFRSLKCNPIEFMWKCHTRFENVKQRINHVSIYEKIY